jgi:NADH-quinone oxidoreductase subunit H
MRWSLFFMAEYAAMVVVASVATTVYLGGWYFPFVQKLEASGYHNLYVLVSVLIFVIKASIILYLYFWLRWTLPRFRYDQLMDIGWKWLIPAALFNIGWSAFTVFLAQALDTWGTLDTIQQLDTRLNLTPAGKGLVIGMGLVGLVVTGVLLSRINWRSRDFHLKTQRRNIRLVDVPKGKPAVS